MTFLAQCPETYDSENAIIAFCEDQMAEQYGFLWDYFVVGDSWSRNGAVNPDMALVDKAGRKAYFMQAGEIDIEASKVVLEASGGSVRDGGMTEGYYDQDAEDKPIHDAAGWLAKLAAETPRAMIAVLDTHL